MKTVGGLICAAVFCLVIGPVLAYISGLLGIVHNDWLGATTDHLYGSGTFGKTLGWLTLLGIPLIAALAFSLRDIANGNDRLARDNRKAWALVNGGAAVFYAGCMALGHPAATVVALACSINALRLTPGGLHAAATVVPQTWQVGAGVAAAAVLALMPLVSNAVPVRTVAAATMIGLCALPTVLPRLVAAQDAKAAAVLAVLTDLLGSAARANLTSARGGAWEYAMPADVADRLLSETEQRRIDLRALVLHPTYQPDLSRVSDDIVRLIPTTQDRCTERSDLLRVPQTATETATAVVEQREVAR